MPETTSEVDGRQAAVAEFGRFALRAHDIQECVARAVDVVAHVLRAPVVALLELLGPGRVAVVHARGPQGLAVDVWRPDEVEIAPPGLSVPVPVDGRPWGRLIVSDDDRPFTDRDVEFVRAIADVLTAALERQRHEAARESIAALGRFALECRRIDLTIERVVDVVTRVVDAPIGAVLRRGTAPGRMRLVQAWGPIGVEPGEEFTLEPRLRAAFDRPGPETVEDWREGGSFPGLAVGGPVASLSVPIVTGRRVWGRLVVADTRPRRFSAAESQVVSSVAQVLAASLEREQVEAAHATVADVSRLALTTRDVDTVVGAAVAAVARAVDAPMVSLVQAGERPGRFALVQGFGPLGVAPGEEFAVPEGFGPGDPVQDGRPPNGDRSTLAVPVLVDGRPWGRLAVLCDEPRSFSPTDLDVVRSVGQVLSAVLERDLVERSLRRTAADLRAALAACVDAG